MKKEDIHKLTLTSTGFIMAATVKDTGKGYKCVPLFRKGGDLLTSLSWELGTARSDTSAANNKKILI